MISVIIPVYNTPEEYLSRCIDSVINQSNPDIEIILINDGSDRMCTDCLLRMKELDPRIQLIQKENGGVSAARNTGLRAARGEYIAFVDSDDWVNPDYLSEGLRFLEEYQMDLVIGSFRVIHKDGSMKVQTLSVDEPLQIYSGERLNRLRKFILSCEPGRLSELTDFRHIGGVVCRLFRRKAIEGCWFNTDIVFAEDALFNLNALGNMERVGIVSEVWYNNRLNDASCTQRYRPNLPREFFHVLAEFESYINSSGYKIRSAFCIRVVKEFTTLMKRYVFDPRTGFNNRNRINFIEEILEGYITDMVRKGFAASDYKFKYTCLVAMLRFQLTSMLFVMYWLKYRKLLSRKV